MQSTVKNLILAFCLVAVGVAICVGLIYVGEYDDAPGASLLGILLMIGAMVLA